jgi:16S rRNA (cytosine1402-N4)-methyltransferase
VTDGPEFDEDSARMGADGKTEATRFGHLPVLLQPAIDFLAIRRGGTFIDATVGLGGHSFEIAKRLGRQGHLIGFDKDPKALEIAAKRLSEVAAEVKTDWPKITLLHGSFRQLAEAAAPGTVSGVLADLGVSSMQFQDAARGFSFQADGFLDMRMDPQAELTAYQVVNQLDEPTLADLIYEFGEERRSRRIARAIVRARPVTTTAELARVVAAAARPVKSERIHPATLTFQALRIYVNRELDDLKALTESAPWVLARAGRLVIISFHSLEDRIVKDAMREGARQGLYELLTRKPVVAGEQEVAENPRSRSAKLRAAARL